MPLSALHHALHWPYSSSSLPIRRSYHTTMLCSVFGELPRSTLPLSQVRKLRSDSCFTRTSTHIMLLGCCPLLRPVFRRMFPELFSSLVANSRPVIWPSTVFRSAAITNSAKAREINESSLTDRPVDLEHGPFDGSWHNEVSTGVRTMISSGSDDWTAGGREQGFELAGIHVYNKTVVEVESV